MKWLDERSFVELILLYTGIVAFISSAASYVAREGIGLDVMVSLIIGALVGLTMGAGMCILLVGNNKGDETDGGRKKQE
jgi:uncharacterized membrane-anchored protein